MDVSRYAKKPIPVVKALFKYWFEKATWHKPAILILDNLHELLSAEVEVCLLVHPSLYYADLSNSDIFALWQHADSFRARHISEIFLSIYSSSSRNAAQNSRGIILIGTATSPAALHPLINSQHIFTEVLNVKAPNKDARRDVSHINELI